MEINGLIIDSEGMKRLIDFLMSSENLDSTEGVSEIAEKILYLTSAEQEEDCELYKFNRYGVKLEARREGRKAFVNLMNKLEGHTYY